MTVRHFWIRRPQTTDSIRTWAHSLAGITEQLVAKDDPEFARSCSAVRVSRNEVSGLLNQLKPTLPVLLANLTTPGTDPRHLQPVAGTTPGAAAAHRLPAAVLRDSRRTTPTACRSATSRSASAIRPRARSVSCRRRNGGHPPTPARSTHPTGSVLQAATGFADLPSAVPATCRAWGTPESAHRQSNSATTPRGISPWRCVQHSLRAEPLRPQPDRAGRPARRSHRLQRQHLRADRGHAAAAGRTGSCGVRRIR